MLEVSNISFSYGDAAALRNVSFNIKEGEFIAIVGANAAGKSTLMKVISGVLKPSAGSITFEGKRIDTLNSSDIVGLGVVQIPEGRQLFPAMTVQENIELGSYHKRAKPYRKESLERVYALFPRVKERAKQLAGTLSGGEQQMVAVGRALMCRPRLLMFDEPALGLAPLMVREIFNLAKTINDSGVTVLMVEQNVNQSLALSNRGYVLENGAITLEGTGRELLDNEDVKKAYLGL